MQVAPTVTTFLFTDIESSTRLWEQEPERMLPVMARHDAISKAAVERNRGTIVKMTGDGVHAAFDNSMDALIATLEIQQRLSAPDAADGMPLPLRCGLHAGIDERRDGDFYGRAVNRAARIMSAAHGGQILLSKAVAEQVSDMLPEGASLRDLGVVRLRDLSTPEHIYQLLHTQLRADFPALRSLEGTPNNLTQQLNSFIGRERELAEIREMLASNRLVTLIGMGGIGKSRLSTQLAADVLDDFPDGVWFVELAAVTDSGLIPQAVASVLGVKEAGGHPVIDALTKYVRDLQLLIILDNCEQVVHGCADLAKRLLQAGPRVKVLTSSRDYLQVAGETSYRVPTLSVPDLTKKINVESLAQHEAVRLFVERAAASLRGFGLTEQNAAAVASLCHCLDGIPLALELAAARVRSLSVEAIAARLDDRFRLLVTGDQTVLPRQRTLRALIDWSYDLLTEAERTLFQRLSAFAGGWTLEAAEAVCADGELRKDEVLDLLAHLVEKSLVVMEVGGARYLMLETIREYAREKLALRGDAAATAARHCEHYFAMAKAASRGQKGPQQADWLWKVEVEIDNIRSAIALSLAGGVDPVVAVKFAVALQGFWILRGQSTEGRMLVQEALALPAVQASPVAQGYALYVGAALAESQSDHAEARKMLETCLELRRALGLEVDIAATLSTLALARLQAGDAVEAAAGESEALQIFRRLEDRIGEAICLLHLGQISLHQGDDAMARTHLAHSLAIAREIRHQEVEGECERMLGEVALERADHSQANLRFKRSLTVCREAGDKRGEALALRWLARVELKSGDVESARARLPEALRAFHAFEMREELLGCLEDHAELAEAEGKFEVAVALAGAAAQSRERLGLHRSPRSELCWQALVGRLRCAMTDAPFNTAWDDGQRLQTDEAISQVLSAHRERATA